MTNSVEGLEPEVNVNSVGIRGGGSRIDMFCYSQVLIVIHTRLDLVREE